MRTVVRLTPDRLEELRGSGAPCATCLRWELDPVRRRRLPDASDADAEKDAWLSRVLREWGSCGRVVLVDDVAVAYAVYAPPVFLPGVGSFATAPVGHDAVVLSTLYVDAAHRGVGWGRLLVQAMAADLIERGGVRAVEAFARHGSPMPSGAPGPLPADFLAAVGFRTARAHPVTPRMRMDLRSAVTWREEVEAALGRLVDAVRPTPVPETARATPAVSTVRTHDRPRRCRGLR